MNRIEEKLAENKKILSLYFTAGFPELNDTVEVLTQMQEAGVDMVEIGLPFSDPLADGPVIQKSSQQALNNGMSVALLFEQLLQLRKTIHLPLIIMGYLNPILQYGMANFCQKCEEIGIDGLIIPDLPPEIFQKEYVSLFKKHGLKFILLVTPQTSKKRIRVIDSLSSPFIYMVSSASTTGVKRSVDEKQEAYFKRLQDMKLKNPLIVGFGISNAATFKAATQYGKGAIIGSAFVKHLEKYGPAGVQAFVKRILR